jgi:hypothetical protein
MTSDKISTSSPNALSIYLFILHAHFIMKIAECQKILLHKPMRTRHGYDNFFYWCGKKFNAVIHVYPIEVLARIIRLKIGYETMGKS